MVHVTRHAEMRLHERCGLNKKSVQRMADRAFEKGIVHKHLRGRLKKWVDSIYLRDKSGIIVKLYGDFAYLFKQDVLVTVMPIPNNLKKDLKVMVNEK